MGQVEGIAVGVFGAFAGGEFLATTLRGPVTAADAGFSAVALGLAVAGALTMLGVLALMRRAVGPMRASKSKTR